MNKTNALALALVAALAAGCTLTLDAEKYAPKSAADCGPNQKVCGYKCVAKDDPATGCGGESCQPCQGDVNAIAVCGDGGTCATQCNLGWGNCDAGAGCETRLNSDTNCGACSRACYDAISPTMAGACDSGGFCRPAEMPSIGKPAGIHVDRSVPAPNPVFFVSDDSGGSLFTTNTQLAASSMVQVATNLGSLSCVWGEASRAVVCKDGPAPAALLQLDLAAAPPVMSTLMESPGPIGEESALAISRATPYKAWWVTPGGDDLRGIELVTAPTVPQATPAYGLPKAGAFRAVAWENYTGLYVADDAAGGRVRNLDLGMNFSFVKDVGTGFGRIGAVAARFAPGTTVGAEVYVADLDTGSVRKQVDGSRQTILAGNGPTPRMRMVADDKGVVWTNAAAGTVMEYRPVFRQLITHHLGGTPGYVTMTDLQILWTDASASRIYVVAR